MRISINSNIANSPGMLNLNHMFAISTIHSDQVVHETDVFVILDSDFLGSLFDHQLIENMNVIESPSNFKTIMYLLSTRMQIIYAHIIYVTYLEKLWPQPPNTPLDLRLLRHHNGPTKCTCVPLQYYRN